MDEKIKQRFLFLSCAMSPENLTCDGEASSAWVYAESKRLQKEWKTLEKQVGRQVSEDEVWGWFAGKGVIE